MNAHTDSVPNEAAVIRRDEANSARARLLSALRDAKFAAWKNGHDGLADESPAEETAARDLEAALADLMKLAIEVAP